MVQKRIERTAVIVLITASYAKNLGIDRNEQSADSACVASAAHQDTQQPNAIRKKTCLEMGVAGEADARLAFGRSVRLVRLLVVVNHRVLPSSPLAGHRQTGFALEPGERGFFDSESNLPRLKSTHVADCKPQAPPGRRWDFALELGLGPLVQNIREPAGWLRS